MVCSLVRSQPQHNQNLTHRIDHAAKSKSSKETKATPRPSASKDNVEWHIDSLPEVDDWLPNKSAAEGRRCQPESSADSVTHVDFWIDGRLHESQRIASRR